MEESHPICKKVMNHFIRGYLVDPSTALVQMLSASEITLGPNKTIMLHFQSE